MGGMMSIILLVCEACSLLSAQLSGFQADLHAQEPAMVEVSGWLMLSFSAKASS